MNKCSIAVLLSVCALWLTGCASPPQLPVSLSSTALAAPNTRVGVVMTAVPKVDTEFPGAGCLLCLAAASMANSSLTTHVQTLSADELLKLKSEMADALRKKGATVTVIDLPIAPGDLGNASAAGPNIAKKDFSSFQKKYNLDKLMVIEISQVGVSRNYATYIPSGDPQGVVKGVAYLVNLKDNSYEWYLPLRQARGSAGVWDEAPAYPGLTNAFYQAIEGTRDSVLLPFN